MDKLILAIVFAALAATAGGLALYTHQSVDKIAQTQQSPTATTTTQTQSQQEPAHPAATTSSTSTTTHTTTSTETAQTTTSPGYGEQGKTETAASTATAAGEGTIEVEEPPRDYREMLRCYPHARIEFGGDNSRGYMEYTVERSGGGYRVAITYAGSNDTGMMNITIFTDETMTSISKVVMPDGQVLEGSMADMAGRQFLSYLNNMLSQLTTVGKPHIESGAVYIEGGWVVADTKKTTVKINGEQHEAYLVEVKSTVPRSTGRATVTIAKVSGDTWMLTGIEICGKDTGTAWWRIVELGESGSCRGR